VRKNPSLTRELSTGTAPEERDSSPPPPPKMSNRSEGAVHPLPVEIIEIGERGLIKVPVGFKDRYQMYRIEIGKRLKQSCVNKGKHPHARADAEASMIVAVTVNPGDLRKRGERSADRGQSFRLSPRYSPRAPAPSPGWHWPNRLLASMLRRYRVHAGAEVSRVRASR